jgi:hypothetical protein
MPDHHPTWRADRPGFFAFLREQGVDYANLKAWLEAADLPKPSAGDTAYRTAIRAAIVRGAPPAGIVAAAREAQAGDDLADLAWTMGAV